MLIKSTYGNTVVRTEELAAIYRFKNNKTGKLTKIIILQFKSGKEIPLECNNLKEAKELFDIINNIMEKDYEMLFKYNKP